MNSVFHKVRCWSSQNAITNYSPLIYPRSSKIQLSHFWLNFHQGFQFYQYMNGISIYDSTTLKVQIRLPPIKFWLTVNLPSLVHKVNLQLPQKSLYLDAIYPQNKIRFFKPVTRDDPLKVHLYLSMCR